MVLTAAGLVAIENIKAGDAVISTNPDTYDTAEKTVLETYVRQVDKLVHLTINGEEIVTTVDHPFYVQGRGFINAGNLLTGDTLISVNGEDLLVSSCYIEECNSPPPSTTSRLRIIILILLVRIEFGCIMQAVVIEPKSIRKVGKTKVYQKL